MIANLADILGNHARRRPHHPAIISDSGTISYAELDVEVRRVARHLRDLGVARGTVVGICLRDSCDHLVALYALAALGAVVLPLDWRWTASEKQRIATFFDANLTLCEPGDPVAEDIPACPVDSRWHAQVAKAHPIERAEQGEQLPFLISLSSGTTGVPKGPLISQQHQFSRFMIYIVSLGFNEEDVHLSVLPLYFGGGRGFAMCALFCGATVRLFPPPFDASSLVAQVRQLRPTITLLVPTIIRHLLAIAEAGSPLFESLRVVASTGAVLHPDERAAALRDISPRLVNFYGSTEGGGLSLLRPEHQGQAAHSVGRPVFGTDVEIVDDSDQSLAMNEIGRIRYRGPGVAPGFHLNPQASAASFKDGWFYPGDLGRLDSEGFLYIAGRAKDMIIRGGVNIYPEEIEQTLCLLDAVRDAAVVGWPARSRGEEVAAFVVARSDIEESTILAHCRERLAPYKVPKAIFFIDELPRSSIGKVRKVELVQRLPTLED